MRKIEKRFKLNTVFTFDVLILHILKLLTTVHSKYRLNFRHCSSFASLIFASGDKWKMRKSMRPKKVDPHFWVNQDKDPDGFQVRMFGKKGTTYLYFKYPYLTILCLKGWVMNNQFNKYGLIFVNCL